MTEEKETTDFVSISDVFKLIEEIEREFPVDSIKLSDGTKLWNLIRVLLVFYVLKQNGGAEAEQLSLKTLLYLLKESFYPLNISREKIAFCGFSGTESRKFRDGKFYDIYMDPLYEVLGNNFYIFEWPTPIGYRRKYRNKVYSNNYVPMRIPIYSKTFFDLGFHKFKKRKKLNIVSEDILTDVIVFFSNNNRIEEERLAENVYDGIFVFFYLREFFIKLLRAIHPKAVFIRCGYGRFHMALSQACRDLNIPSIELQHGLITTYHVGYVKSTESGNCDCVPEYLLTYGDFFSEIVRKGKLFNPEKVITIGFPYIEEVKKAPPLILSCLNDFLSNFSLIILVTSQWTVAEEIKNFIIAISKELDCNVGIVFKPHPRDWREYSDLKNYGNIFLASKYDDIYELLKVVDIHSTVYSTSGIEALAFGIPNIFINVSKSRVLEIFDILDEKTSFFASSPKQFISKLEFIIANYEYISKETFKISEPFFKSHAKENTKEFLNSINIYK